tara:strand:- start:2382 stop:2726 length:345 start_codon:yes stop_codon:yes gene_type:complete
LTYKFLIIFLILFISCTDTKQYTNPEHIVAKSLVIVDDYDNKRIELNTSSGHARIVIYNENEIPRIVLYSSEISTLIEMKNDSYTVGSLIYVPWKGGAFITLDADDGSHNLLSP